MKINRAGGGGHSTARIEKLQQKNSKLNEERKRLAAKDVEAENEAPGGEASTPYNEASNGTKNAKNEKGGRSGKSGTQKSGKGGITKKTTKKGNKKNEGKDGKPWSGRGKVSKKSQNQSKSSDRYEEDIANSIGKEDDFALGIMNWFPS